MIPSERRIQLRQRRDLGEIIRDALQIYAQNAGPFLLIATVVMPLIIAGTIFQDVISNEASAAGVGALVTVGQIAVSLVVGAAIVSAIGEIDAGRAPDFSQAIDAAFQRFWTLLRALLRVALVVLLLAITIVGIPWAIRQAVRWIFVEQLIMLEGAEAGEALGRSSGLVIGSWWRTLGISLVIGLVTGVPAGLVAALAEFAPPLAAGLANAAATAVILPFAIIGTTLLYFDRVSAKAVEPSTGTSS